jgi:hypothetical protein
LIEPAIFARVGSTPAAAVAFVVSTDMSLVPAPRETTARLLRPWQSAPICGRDCRNYG